MVLSKRLLLPLDLEIERTLTKIRKNKKLQQESFEMVSPLNNTRVVNESLGNEDNKEGVGNNGLGVLCNRTRANGNGEVDNNGNGHHTNGRLLDYAMPNFKRKLKYS
ncbi:hypothetical protein ACH5RR_039170 [Cinchona calisaya]|uniref:Uncharacterized protein n=1 Tax=Cinchona calisaya TaxID=153742 RepID=A0ABD2Y0X5_9GENT